MIVWDALAYLAMAVAAVVLAVIFVGLIAHMISEQVDTELGHDQRGDHWWRPGARHRRRLDMHQQQLSRLEHDLGLTPCSWPRCRRCAWDGVRFPSASLNPPDLEETIQR